MASVALLFNVNKDYYRGIVSGIATYAQAQGCQWSMLMEDDFYFQLHHFRYWQGDGIIADLDHPDVIELVRNTEQPVVGVGGSYQDQRLYPRTPYVASDNDKIGIMAAEHLVEQGLTHFGFYGTPHIPGYFWSAEREKAFTSKLNELGFSSNTLHRVSPHHDKWPDDRQRLINWLQQLPKPVGIMACNDSKAVNILSVCNELGYDVPSDVAVIGVDDDELTCKLCTPPLSSIRQDNFELGFAAAQTLHKLIDQQGSSSITKVSPAGVVARHSTNRKLSYDPLVIKALTFIRKEFANGVRSDQVAQHVNLSRAQLEKRFKSATCKTIHEHIHEARITEARRLLLESQKPIMEVSKSVGFSTPQYFNYVFKKEFNCTPAEFRNTDHNRPS